MAAAAAAACRGGLLLHHHHHQWPPRCAASHARSISQLIKTNGRRAFLVDTLALVRKLESQGVPTKQAEAITSAITEVLNDSLESISESFISKAEMQKGEMLQEANISKFKSQVQSSQAFRCCRSDLPNSNIDASSTHNDSNDDSEILKTVGDNEDCCSAKKVYWSSWDGSSSVWQYE